MPQLKKSVIAKILQRLDAGKFTQYDFEVAFPDAGKTLVTIHFKSDEKYHFSINEEATVMSIAASAVSTGRSELVPTTVESPGDAKAVEKNYCQSLATAINRIDAWTSNIYDDLRTRSIELKEIDQLRKQIEEHFTDHLNDPDEFFSAEEADHLTSRLNTLLKSFEKLQAEHKITQESLDEVRKDIERIKESATEVPKGVWAAMAKNRFVIIAKRVFTSPEGREFALAAAKRLLLEDSSPKA